MSAPTQQQMEAWETALESCTFPGTGPNGDVITSAARCTFPGMEGARLGFAADANPHPEGSDLWYFWHRGWLRFFA